MQQVKTQSGNIKCSIWMAYVHQVCVLYCRMFKTDLNGTLHVDDSTLHYLVIFSSFFQSPLLLESTTRSLELHMDCAVHFLLDSLKPGS